MEAKLLVAVLLVLAVALSGCVQLQSKPGADLNWEAAVGIEGIADENREGVQEGGEEVVPAENLCGNGVVDANENCANCPQDVNCLADENCVNGECVKIEEEEEESKPTVELQISLTKYYPSIGDRFVVLGDFRHEGQQFEIEFNGVLKKAFTEYEAMFSLYDANNNKIDSRILSAPNELQFYEKGQLIQFTSFIYLRKVLVPPRYE